MSEYFKKIHFFLFLVIVSASACGQDDALKKAKSLLDSGASVSAILSDMQFDNIRSETSFRELIKQNADQKTVTLVTNKEEGTRITIKGTILKKEQPLANTLVYIYQTDTRGWYGNDRVHFQMNEGDRKHARLFAYFKTNTKGGFEFITIQPHGYPQSDLPAHIHFEVFDKEKALLISELLFDDDERLQGSIRSRAEKEGFFISKPAQKNLQKIYQYSISIN